jgi:hypothetical protein
MQSEEASRPTREFCILHYQGTTSSVDGVTTQTTVNLTDPVSKTANLTAIQYLANCLNLLLVVTSIFSMNDYCGCFLNFYCCTVHFDNVKIPFTNKCTLH